MKYILVLIGVTFMAFNSLNAQDPNQFAFFGASFGQSIPLGDFRSKDIRKEKAGFAGDGIKMDIGGDFKILKNFEASFMFRRIWQDFDHRAYNSGLKNSNLSKTWLPGNQTWQISKWDKWKSNSLMLGGNYMHSLNEDSTTFLSIKSMIGFTSTTLPQIKYSSSDTVLTQEIKETNSPSFLVGWEVKTRVYKSIYFLIGMDYFTTNPQFVGVEVKSNKDGYSKKQRYINKPVEILNFDAGIKWRFN